MLAPVPATPAQQPLVLVVDDTPDVLLMTHGLLRDSYRVQIANSGIKGLELARSQAAPDLILLDVVMPGMDGYAVCRALKQDPNTRDIPVIFLTSMSDFHNEEYAPGKPILI